MKLYLVHGFINQPDVERSPHHTFFKWLGTQADCAAYSREQIDNGAKRSNIKIDEIDVPTDKAGLLAFLNKSQFA